MRKLVVVVKWEDICFSTAADSEAALETSSKFDGSFFDSISGCLGRLRTGSF